MAVTLNGLTLVVEDMLYGLPQIERPVEDTLKTAVSAANDVTWQFDTAALWRRGDYAETVGASGAVGEVVILTADYSAGVDVTVRRGQLGSTAASSYSIGDVVRKNPQYPRVKIQRVIDEVVDALYPDVWIRTSRSLDINPGRYYYPLNASDFEVEQVFQADISNTAIGNATFANAGDLWTLTAHGLTVGEAVRFTAAGTGAAGYAVNTVYWVAAVPSSSTFQLSATESTTVLVGTSDSAGTWTLERIDAFQFSPLPADAWEVVTGVDSRTSSTGRILRLKGYYSDADTLYYQAKTKPSSSSYSDIPDIMGDFIPYGAVWLLVGGTRVIPQRYDPLRSQPERVAANQPMVDSRFFRDEFERRKAEYRRQLDADLYPNNYLGRNRVVRK